MNEKERYIVATLDGTMYTVVAETFAEVLGKAKEEGLNDEEIWQITKLHYED